MCGSKSLLRGELVLKFGRDDIMEYCNITIIIVSLLEFVVTIFSFKTLSPQKISFAIMRTCTLNFLSMAF